MPSMLAAVRSTVSQVVNAAPLSRQPLAAVLLQHAQALLGGLGTLARVQQRLLLRLHGLLGLELCRLERVERTRARQHLRVMLGLLRGTARGQPVGIALALGQRLAARPGVLQLGLLQRRLRGLLGLAPTLDLVAQLLGRGLVEKVVEQQWPLHLGQVADYGAAQADQKAGEHQRHQPQAATKPLFR